MSRYLQPGPLRQAARTARALAALCLLVPVVTLAARRHHDEDDDLPAPNPEARPCPELDRPRALTLDGHSALEVRVKMDIDVDGAPNAYGPRGKKALDTLDHAYGQRGTPEEHKIVGFMTEYEGGPPTVQRAGDPYPGYYVSQTDFADKHNPRMEDPRRYVDATRISYVVLGKAAQAAGVRMGDYVTVYSCRTGRSVYAIVADSGNDTGAEGSLALAQALGYPATNGIDYAVEEPEILIRYYPRSNPEQLFFKTQAELNRAAKERGLPLY